jgi:hypothetical protein
MKRQGATEDALFAEYRRLHSQLKDDVFARSWFRDQVLHPHETQHTLAEMLPLIERCGMRLLATSINNFAPIVDLPALLEAEQQLDKASREAIARGEYYPGFFVFLARKDDRPPAGKDQ